MSLQVNPNTNVQAAELAQETTEAKKAVEDLEEGELFSETTETTDASTDTATISTTSSKPAIENEAQLTAKKTILADKQKKLDKLTEKYEENAEAYEEIEKKIAAAIDAEEDDQKSKSNAVYAAMADYNPDKDGDYNDYMKKSLKGILSDDATSRVLSALSDESEEIVSDLAKLKSDIKDLSDEVSSLEKEIGEATGETSAIAGNVADAKARLNALAEKSGIELKNQINDEGADSDQAILALADLMDSGLISDCEMAVLIKANIDITAKDANGNPKYVIAKGKNDGKYHVYMSSANNGSAGAGLIGGGCNSYTSLPRMFVEGGGFDIIENGNGYLNSSNGFNFDAGEKSDDSDAFYYGECGQKQAACGDYCTSSPLSFDLNGDGVKTSNKVIDYDIDGDGIADKINDSLDAVLVFDKDNDGVSGKDGSECFGDNTDLDGDGVADGYKDGFEALKAIANKYGLVGNGDNKLDSNDIKFLEQTTGLKIKTNGYNSEATSLLENGVTEINLATTSETTLNKNYDGNKNDLMTQEGATFTVNGQEREYADIWHSKKEETSAAALKAELKSVKNADETEYTFNYTDTEALMDEINNRFDKISNSKKYIDELRATVKASNESRENIMQTRMLFAQNKYTSLKKEDKTENEKAA